MPDIELGNNYTVEEDSNGDLVITDGDGTPVMTHDDSADTWTLADSTGVNDLTDATSGATVYDSSAEELTADVNNGSVSTENLSNIALFYDDANQSLQTLVDNNRVVLVAPGSYSSQSWPIDPPNNTTVRGFDSPFAINTNHQYSTLFDAAGGRAFAPSGDANGNIFNVNLIGFAVNGSILYDQTGGTEDSRNWTVKDLHIWGADSAQHSGRGLELAGGGHVMYEVENLFVNNCDGYGVYSEHGGQAKWDGIKVFRNGQTVDGAQAYFSDAGGGGGEGRYRDLTVASFTSGVDGVVFDAIENPQIIAPQIEGTNSGNHGLFFKTDSGQVISPSIIGGRIFTWAGDGVHIDNAQNGNLCKTGFIGGGAQIDNNTGTAIVFDNSDAQYWHIGFVTDGLRALNPRSEIDTSAGGPVTADPSLIANKFPVGEDLTTVTATFVQEMAFHDGTNGTNTNAAGPAWWDGGAWVSLIDGGTIA